MSKLTKKKTILLLAAAGIAFALRLYVYVVMMDHANMNALMTSVPTGYLSEAENIVNGGQWFMGTLNGHDQLMVLHPKGYSVLLACLMELFGTRAMSAAHLLMILLDSFTCILIQSIIQTVFHNEAASFTGAFLWALNPFAVINCSQDLPDAFSGFLCAMILWIYYHSFRHAAKHDIILGLFTGLAVYFRAEFMLLLAAAFLSDWIRSRSFFKSLRACLISILSLLLVLSPWICYSYRKTGHPMISSQNAWGAAYSAIGEYKENSWHIVYGDDVVDAEARDAGFDSAWTYDGNQYFKQKFITYVTENPKEYLYIITHYRLLNAFVPNAFSWFNLNRADTPFHFRTYCSSKGSLNQFCQFSFRSAAALEQKPGRMISAILLACMLLLLVQAIKKHSFRQESFLFLVWLYFPVMISCLKQIEPRNVFPSEVVLTIAAAVILSELMQCLMRKTNSRRNVNQQ